jgi:hypothetical protein
MGVNFLAAKNKYKLVASTRCCDVDPSIFCKLQAQKQLGFHKYRVDLSFQHKQPIKAILKSKTVMKRVSYFLTFS